MQPSAHQKHIEGAAMAIEGAKGPLNPQGLEACFRIQPITDQDTVDRVRLSGRLAINALVLLLCVTGMPRQAAGVLARVVGSRDLRIVATDMMFARAWTFAPDCGAARAAVRRHGNQRWGFLAANSIPIEVMSRLTGQSGYPPALLPPHVH
jgi:hypothetical protein